MNQKQLQLFEGIAELHTLGAFVLFTIPATTEKGVAFRKLVGIAKNDEFTWVHRDFVLDN